MLTGEPIDRHHHQSPNVEDNNTNTSSNQKQDIFDIELESGSDYEVIDVGGASQEGTYGTDDEVDTVLCFGNILPLVFFFCKANFLFIVVFRTYLHDDNIFLTNIANLYNR